MDWTQIETKWAAMTRRVRADWTPDAAPGNALRTPAAMVSDKAPGTLLKARTAALNDQGAIAKLAPRQPFDAGSKTLAE